jgi:hypothetical protein
MLGPFYLVEKKTREPSSLKSGLVEEDAKTWQIGLHVHVKKKKKNGQIKRKNRTKEELFPQLANGEKKVVC